MAHEYYFIDDYEAELALTMDRVSGVPDYYFFNKLTEEVGEVAEVNTALLGSSRKKRKLLAKHKTIRDALHEELSDVINVVAILARRHEIRMDDLFEMGTYKMSKKNSRSE